MSQVHITVNDKLNKIKENPLEKFKKQFEEINSKPTYRVVKLKIKLPCGCGDLYGNIERTVPYNSDVQDGDIIEMSEVKKDDIITEVEIADKYI